MALLLLQLANFALAAASLWIHLRAPWTWDGQAIVFASSAGALAACVTALFLGITLIAKDEPGWIRTSIHMVLVVAFAGLQGYLLFLTGRDLGVLEILKSRLNGG